MGVANGPILQTRHMFVAAGCGHRGILLERKDARAQWHNPRLRRVVGMDRDSGSYSDQRGDSSPESNGFHSLLTSSIRSPIMQVVYIPGVGPWFVPRFVVALGRLGASGWVGGS